MRKRRVASRLRWLVGSKMERLTMVEVFYHGGRNWFKCQCDCGTIVKVRPDHFGTHNKSCGCLGAEHRRASTTTHGMSSSREYMVWSLMRFRCSNPTATYYANYGGRGIGVCPRWNKFENFLSDMGRCPDGMMLDRKDNDIGYEPSNCRWVTRLESNRNKRNVRRFTLNGVEKTVPQWCDDLGIKGETVRRRINLGWSVDKALLTPVLIR